MKESVVGISCLPLVGVVHAQCSANGEPPGDEWQDSGFIHWNRFHLC